MLDLVETSVLLCVLTTLIIYYFKSTYNYWKRKHVPYIEPTIPLGNVTQPFDKQKGFSMSMKDCYDTFKARGERFGGIYFFTRPVLMPIEPELIKRIFTKDFQYFMDHGANANEKKDPLSAHLFNLTGQAWKNMRNKLSPTFTSGKMKMMFHTLLTCGDQLINHTDSLCEDKKPLDIKDVIGCFSTDVIGSCAFGIDCNSFKNPNSEFRKCGNSFFEPSINRNLGTFINSMSPRLHKLLQITETRAADREFFLGTFKSVYNHRRTNNITRNDFVQILIDMRKQAEAENAETFTEEQMAAHSFIFFVAGFETASTLSTFCLHELSYNHDIQERLRTEVVAAMERYEGKLTYNGMMEMKYMDMVLNETLRKYPAVQDLNRVCTKDYVIPGTSIRIEKGTRMFISVQGLHHDPEYYPDPNKFDPERFTEENIARRPQLTFVPFGDGPRLCIGLRFGLMQTKIAISLILKNYKILPHKDSQYNIEFDQLAPILTSKNPILLNIEKI